MNIIENGKIDWSMFGMAVKNFRRGKALDPDQFAEAINRTDGGEKPIITGAQVERIENGKLVPTVEQFTILERMSGTPGLVTSMVCSIADGLMAAPKGADPVGQRPAGSAAHAVAASQQPTA